MRLIEYVNKVIDGSIKPDLEADFASGISRQVAGELIHQLKGPYSRAPHQLQPKQRPDPLNSTSIKFIQDCLAQGLELRFKRYKLSARGLPEINRISVIRSTAMGIDMLQEHGETMDLAAKRLSIMLIDKHWIHGKIEDGGNRAK